MEKDFFKLPADIQGAFFSLMEAWLMGKPVEISYFGQERIQYFRHRVGKNPYRLYFITKDDLGIVIHVAYKNQQKIDKKTRALLVERAKRGHSRPIT